MTGRLRAGLNGLYDRLNEELFEGRLPRFRVALFGSFRGGQDGECLDDRRLIRLRRHLAPDDMRRVLLHEMCHVGCPGHRQRFQAKLLRLAMQFGEAWAADEAEMCRTAPTWNQEMSNLRGDMDDLLLDIPRVRFQTAVRLLAGNLGMTSRELLLLAPWMRAAWKNAKTASRALSKKGGQDHPPGSRANTCVS